MCDLLRYVESWASVWARQCEVGRPPITGHCLLHDLPQAKFFTRARICLVQRLHANQRGPPCQRPPLFLCFRHPRENLVDNGIQMVPGGKGRPRERNESG
eukprot:5489611-Prymnesium_polylepis.1